MSDDPFKNMTHADFMEALKSENWTETQGLHTPTLDATLTEITLTLKFASGHEETLQRSDVEALTRFLTEYAKVEPLPAPDDSFLKDWKPTRVDE